MTEEVTIKLRTEVEGTEDVKDYKNQMAQVQKQTETATRTAQKAGKEMSASALNINKLAQNLGKLSPTLGRITQGINRMTASWKKYDAQVKASRGGITDMPNQLGNRTASRASKIGTGAKVAGVALAAGAASMIFNAITGSGAKLAGFDKLNTLGSPSILDPIIPYLKGIDENTEKTAEATSAIDKKMDGPKGGVAVPIAVGLSVPATEYESIFNGLENYQKEANTRVWQDYENKAQSTLTKVKEMANVAITPAKQAQQTADKIVQTAKVNKTAKKEDNRIIPDGFYMTPSGTIMPITKQDTIKDGPFDWYGQGETQYALAPGGALLYNQDGTPYTRATPQAPEPVKEKEWWENITDPLGDLGGAILDGYNDVIDGIAGAIPDELATISQTAIKGMSALSYINPMKGALDRAEYDRLGKLSVEEYKKEMAGAAIDTALEVATLGGGVAVKGARTVLKAADKATDAIKATTNVAEESVKKSISVTTDGVQKTSKVIDDITDANRKAIEAEIARGEAMIAEEEARLSLSKAVVLEVENVEKVAVTAEESIRKSASKLEDLYLRIKGDPFIDSGGTANIPVGKVKKGADVVDMDDLFAKADKSASKSKLMDTVKNIAKTTGIIGVASLAFDGIRNLFGFAEGGVFMPNQPQMAILGDNKTEPEVAAPYSLIVKAVGDAIRSNQGATAISGPTKIEVPVSLNGKVIARAVYDDLESERRRRNGSVVL